MYYTFKHNQLENFLVQLLVSSAEYKLKKYIILKTITTSKLDVLNVKHLKIL